MPKAKFNFIPAHQLNQPQKVNKIWVAFNPTTKMLVFNQKHSPEVASYKGRYVQVFADIENRTLAWAFAPAEWQKPEELKGYDPIRNYGKAGGSTMIAIYIPTNVAQALKMDKKFKRVDVEVYNPTSLSDLNKQYHYISLNDINYTDEQETEQEG